MIIYNLKNKINKIQFKMTISKNDQQNVNLLRINILKKILPLENILYEILRLEKILEKIFN